MRLTPYTSKSNGNGLSHYFDDDFFFNLPLSSFEQIQGWFPAVDIVEEQNHFILKADLPGIKKEDLKVSFEEGVLRLEGERNTKEEHKDKQVHRIERNYGRFVRTVNLGKGVDASKIQASYKDGVLEITIPKLEESKPKTIDIKVV